MHVPGADSQHQISAYALIICWLARFPHTHPTWVTTRTGKKEDACSSCVIWHTTSAGGMYIMHVYFWFPLTGDSWSWNYINPKVDMAICNIFTRSSPVSVLEKTIIFPSLPLFWIVCQKKRRAYPPQRTTHNLQNFPGKSSETQNPFIKRQIKYLSY